MPSFSRRRSTTGLGTDRSSGIRDYRACIDHSDRHLLTPTQTQGILFIGIDWRGLLADRATQQCLRCCWGEGNAVIYWVQVLVVLLAVLVVIWFAFIVVLAMQARRYGSVLTARDVLRLGPDVVRLISRLVRDPQVPWGTRVLLVLLLAYLLSPIDLVPDFIPMLGYADDVLIAIWALRLAVRGAGRAAVELHWPGSLGGLSSVLFLVGLSDSAASSDE